MDTNRKYARTWLQNKATKTQKEKVIEEANLTPHQLEVLEMTLNEDSQVKQSFITHEDVSGIKRTIRKVYDKIYLVLKSNFLATQLKLSLLKIIV